jgi:hypothetical protein
MDAMKEEYICYCGVYCGNCAVKAKVRPAASDLYKEMRIAGYEDFIGFIPNGKEFWTFLKFMAENGTCDSCKNGGGDPGCKIRMCARGKGVEMCAFCGEYPCGIFDGLHGGHPELYQDNALLREKGMKAWAEMQDGRESKKITFQELR